MADGPCNDYDVHDVMVSGVVVVVVVSGSELDRDPLRDQTLLEGLGHQTLEPALPAVAIRQGEVVHVHADEAVGPGPIESPAELQRILDGGFTM